MEGRHNIQNMYVEKRVILKNVVKASKEYLRLKDEDKMSVFNQNKTFWKWVIRDKQRAAGRVIGITNKRGKMVWDEKEVRNVGRNTLKFVCKGFLKYVLE